MTELELIEKAQDGLAKTKKALKAIQKLNTEQGRHMAANSAMGLHGDLEAWHAKAMAELDYHFPELSSPIAVRGGGGSGR